MFIILEWFYGPIYVPICTIYIYIYIIKISMYIKKWFTIVHILRIVAGQRMVFF